MRFFSRMKRKKKSAAKNKKNCIHQCEYLVFILVAPLFTILFYLLGVHNSRELQRLSRTTIGTRKTYSEIGKNLSEKSNAKCSKTVL